MEWDLERLSGVLDRVDAVLHRTMDYLYYAECEDDEAREDLLHDLARSIQEVEDMTTIDVE